MLSTRASGEAIDPTPLLADETGQAQAKPISYCCSLSTFFRRAQFAKSIINTLIFPSYTNAVLITQLASLSEDFFGMSYISLGVSIPLSMAFAIAEAYAHNVQSEHFDHIEQSANQADRQQTDLEAGQAQPAASGKLAPVTRMQTLCTAVHFASDVSADMVPYLAIGQVAGLYQAPVAVRAATLSAVGVFNLVANVKEATNTYVAFGEANYRKNQPR